MSKKQTNPQHPGDRKPNEGTEKGSIKERSYSERAWGGVTEGYQPIKDVTSDPPSGGSGVPAKEKED